MSNFLFLFSLGGVGYCIVEILWRGYTHWSMFVLGGICLFLLYHLFGVMRGYPIVIKAVAGGALITLLEFITGCIVNLLLHWNVWSYAQAPFNLLGQICLPYALLWVLLCIPLTFLCVLVEKYIG